MKRIEREPAPWYGDDDIHLAEICHEDEIDEDPLAPSRGAIRGILIGLVLWIVGITAILVLRGK